MIDDVLIRVAEFDLAVLFGNAKQAQRDGVSVLAFLRVRLQRLSRVIEFALDVADHDGHVVLVVLDHLGDYSVSL